ncbi:hypothetical protein P3342_010237 [Pyrenophora teres f. teres]|nr:hypothetical protein PTNB85_07794 [Pyrenophora teres f. teres]KAE8829768.1 hypothetical protein HRS9139_06392 [Pyrenophora teres f. teres]KAE8841893.1 hypothetical protein HRS9122_06019 [Pyrenophora teres f. teres]KAE8859997.1 hypothetical protein PTNB29_07228 [Pyrenophora teres f. teres]KAE8865374.1 hypothetical protein PTNB73_06262 [Pyrenophora teres f. teres]
MMVNSLLFKWEDSQALKHHCGFCERPLSHPSARASCFGKHSEPCARFHQAMFMRLRGHTCAHCISIDEAHYKRHHDIAEQLRAVYESCSEINWGIVPSKSDDDSRGRVKKLGDALEQDENHDPNHDSGDTPASKRERKDAKRLARAANRSKVITQEEIRYIDNTIHSSRGLTGNDADGPQNAEEVEDIERQLRYHAHVYNTQVDRKGLRKLAAASTDTSVDFDAEMTRILDAFRISELLKRNTKTRGLQGKELKTFLTTVEGLKQALVEDIILVKKDAAEVRMRRAGYLRYTNKTAYEIVEERYTDKDWKTGEKWVPGAAGFSGNIIPVDEFLPRASDGQEYQTPQRLRNPRGPDRRHLENTHKRINGEDGLYEDTIEPYRTPLLPLPPDPTPSKKSAAVRVINIKTTECPSTLVQTADSQKKDCSHPVPDGWQTVTHGGTPTNVVARPRVWGNIRSQRLPDTPHPTLAIPPSQFSEFPPLGLDAWNPADDSVKAPEVQPSAWTAQEPEGFVVELNESTKDQPVISQKKKAKKSREAKRKAKKLAVVEDTPDYVSSQAEPAEVADDTDAVSTAVTTPVEYENKLREIACVEQIFQQLDGIKNNREIEQLANATAQDPELSEKTASASKPPSPPVTTYGKHRDWLRFLRKLDVDQLSSPIPPSCSGCSHATSCVFENNEIPDCPFHEPFCDCADPMRDQCYLVLPSDEMYSTGPYNRIRAEKLMALYETDHRTKGRLMLVDDDMLDYLLDSAIDGFCNRGTGDMPARLAKELIDSVNKRTPTPLIEQECRFQKLWVRNNILKKPLTQDMLRDIQSNSFECIGARAMCYCRDVFREQMPTAEDIIACSYRECTIQYFHRSCVKNLGVEKVSRWYCADCAQEMRDVAHDTLHHGDFTITTNKKVNNEPPALMPQEVKDLFDKKLDELMQLSNEDFANQMPAKVRKVIAKIGGPKALTESLKKRIVEEWRKIGESCILNDE